MEFNDRNAQRFLAIANNANYFEQARKQLPTIAHESQALNTYSVLESADYMTEISILVRCQFVLVRVHISNTDPLSS